MPEISIGQYNLVVNTLSFSIAAMGATTLFLWLCRGQVAAPYRIAVTLSGIVTVIAFYHYWRIFNSWTEAYTIVDGAVMATGKPFNDAYRYVDWLLTVPLLLVELILVMRLSAHETFTKSVRLGLLATLMVILGYPGEISDVSSTRLIWWSLSMLPFLWIVYELFIGLRGAIAAQPPAARALVSQVRYLTIAAWAFYPIVFLFPMIGLTGSGAETFVQIGYSIADVVAKALIGIMIFLIAVKKSATEVTA
jgi:bacteriorhodopsin